MQVTEEMLYKYVPLAAEELLSQYSASQELPFQPSEEFARKMNKLFCQSKHPKLHFKFLTRAGQVAAIVVLCIALAAATTFSLKAAEVLRIRFQEQVQQNGYVEEHYAVTGEGQLKYFTYIPEGYREEYIKTDNSGYIQKYTRSAGGRILLMAVYLSDGMGTTTDTEYTERYEITIGDVNCTVTIKESGFKNYVYIMDGILYNLAVSDVAEEEVVEMIEMMK